MPVFEGFRAFRRTGVGSAADCRNPPPRGSPRAARDRSPRSPVQRHRDRPMDDPRLPLRTAPSWTEPHALLGPLEPGPQQPGAASPPGLEPRQAPPIRAHHLLSVVTSLALVQAALWVDAALTGEDPGNGMAQRWISVALEHPWRLFLGIALVLDGLLGSRTPQRGSNDSPSAVESSPLSGPAGLPSTLLFGQPGCPILHSNEHDLRQHRSPPRPDPDALGQDDGARPDGPPGAPGRGAR